MKYITLTLILMGYVKCWGQSLNNSLIGTYRFDTPNTPDSTGLAPPHPMESISIDSNLQITKTGFHPYYYSHCFIYYGNCEIYLDTLKITYDSKLNTCEINYNNFDEIIRRVGIFPPLIERYLVVTNSGTIASIRKLDIDQQEYTKQLLTKPKRH